MARDNPGDRIMRPLASPFMLGPRSLLPPVSGCSSGGTGSIPDKSSTPVVVYTSVDDVCARPVAEQFTKDTGIQVQIVPDTEETKSTGLLNRLIAEKSRPQADVFWSGDPVRAGILKKKGVSAPYESQAAT